MVGARWQRTGLTGEASWYQATAQLLPDDLPAPICGATPQARY
jgi:hypothetical protein